jgi:hypothetical protein
MRERWSLTWRGWSLGAGVLLLVGFLGVDFGASFFHANQPIAAEVLIVEGWLPDYALRDASQEFKRGHYRYLITAGGPILRGFQVSGGKTYAGMAASTLFRLGVSSNLVKAVPGPMVWQARGLTHAIAVKDWLRTNDPAVLKVNVYSLGVYARRNQRLFQSVLGPNVEVGIVAHPDHAFDEKRWWASSEGVRAVMGECLSYAWMLLGSEHVTGERPAG